jgi:hypothetical protein
VIVSLSIKVTRATTTLFQIAASGGDLEAAIAQLIRESCDADTLAGARRRCRQFGAERDDERTTWLRAEQLAVRSIETGIFRLVGSRGHL